MPVQSLGQRLLRALISEPVQFARGQGFQALQKMQKRQAAALHIQIIKQHRQRSPKLLQAFNQMRPGFFSPWLCHRVSPRLSHQKRCRLPMKSVEKKMLAGT